MAGAETGAGAGAGTGAGVITIEQELFALINPTTDLATFQRSLIDYPGDWAALTDTWSQPPSLRETGIPSPLKEDSLLIRAARNNRLDIVNYLLRLKTDAEEKRALANQSKFTDGQTPLLIATRNGCTDIVQALLAAGANVDQALTITGQRPLHLATQFGRTDILKELLNLGADINKAHNYGHSPLEIAIDSDYLDIIQELIRRGANINEVFICSGLTPLSFAASKGKLEVVKALLVAGANVNQANRDGGTPLHVADSSEGYLEDLIRGEDFGNPKVVKALLDAGANVNQADHKGNTPLHIAASDENPEVVKALLDAGANVNQANHKGNTPLHIATRSADWGVLEALLAKGADIINKQNRYGETPLSSAAKHASKFHWVGWRITDLFKHFDDIRCKNPAVFSTFYTELIRVSKLETLAPRIKSLCEKKIQDYNIYTPIRVAFMGAIDERAPATATARAPASLFAMNFAGAGAGAGSHL
jgi:ankyrin repeat protein